MKNHQVIIDSLPQGRLEENNYKLVELSLIHISSPRD